MIYPYRCNGCGEEFEVIKAVADIDRQELCPKCSSVGVRYISTTHFYGASDWHGPEYNPGLGCIVESNKHKRQILKERGLEEIGTTSAETLHKMQDRARAEKEQKAINQAREETRAWLNN